MKIAIASSGLGHVTRGIETWALDTALALSRHGSDVVLFSGAPVDGQGARLTITPLHCLKRTDARTRLALNVLPRALWRWGLASDYGIEQWSFWRKLERHLGDGSFDILHVQDPMLAFWCRRARLAGRIRTKEILAHGTEEPAGFLAQFPYVQHLAPWHLKQTLESGEAINAKGAKQDAKNAMGSVSCWTAMPNFVDCHVFRPPTRDERVAARAAQKIPADALVVGCVAAVKRGHKRIDYLIQEAATAVGRETTSTSAPLYVLIAGSRTDESDDLARLAQDVAGDRIRILTNLERRLMPSLYQAMDIFVLPSLFEMMPIAVLEALASGLPVLAHQHPVLEWMVGPGGRCIDMSRDGELSKALSTFRDDRGSLDGMRARVHAEVTFDVAIVMKQYLEYYQRVLAS